jgi:hypothetical protein
MSASGVVFEGATPAANGFDGRLSGCLIPSGAAISETHTSTSTRTESYMVGIGDEFYGFDVRDYYGHAEDDTGVYRTAANAIYDQSGSQYSMKVTPTAGSTYGEPFRVQLWEQWVDANPTLTVECFYDAATALNDDECWIEIEYPDATNKAHKKLDVTARSADVTTAGNRTGAGIGASALDATDWTGESGSNQQFDKLAVTISGGAAGVHRVFFCLATGATTPAVYVCPDVDVS